LLDFAVVGGEVGDFCWTPNDDIVVTTPRPRDYGDWQENELRVFDLDGTFQYEIVIEGYGSKPYDIQISPTGDLLAHCVGSRGTWVAYADGTGAVHASERGAAVAWSPDGRHLVFDDSSSTGRAKNGIFLLDTTLLLRNPNGGEVLIAGSAYLISWLDNGPVSDVAIEYSADNGQSWTDVNTVSNTGTYQWLVPQVHSNQCLVRITDANDPNIRSTSNAVFTVEMYVPVPDVVGMSQADANSAIVSAGFTTGRITYSYTDTVAAGEVMRQSPRAGAAIRLGSIVNLVVSLRPPAVFHVDDDAPGDPGPSDPCMSDPNEDGSAEHPFDAIQEAVDSALVIGDTVLVLPGTYTGQGNRDIDFEGKPITVRSADPNDPSVVAATVIDCNGTETEPHRGFYFHSAEDANSTLSGLTITNGCARLWPNLKGGGILCDGASPRILNNIIAGNWASSSGGGIHCGVGSPVIANNTITGNSARFKGGGIGCMGSSAIITSNVLIRNISLCCGAALYCRESSPIVTDCLFIDNSVTDPWCDDPGGGGIFNERSSPVVTNCRFIGNRADRGKYGSIYPHGGGIYSGRGCHPTLTNCTFHSNFAWENGGGMYSRGSATVTNCTFSHNFAHEQGGGMYSYGGSPTVTNCILWANCDIDGTDESAQIHGDSPVVNYSCIQSWTGALGGIGNIGVDPCFVDPGYWDPNGTPGDANNDYWVDGDYHLLPGSPCIDTGDPNHVPRPNETDLDGKPRVLDGDEDGNSVVDMGAYEFWPPIECPMHFTPKAVNLRSRGKWIKARFVLPAGYTIEDVDANTPATIVELGLYSEHVRVFSEGGLVKVEAVFDRREFCRAGPLEGLVTVEGTLANGRCFQGAESIKIVGRNSELLADLASYWLVLDCGSPDWCGGSDLNRDSIVDFEDFALFDSCCEVIE
jgi:hypothetical protein